MWAKKDTIQKTTCFSWHLFKVVKGNRRKATILIGVFPGRKASGISCLLRGGVPKMISSFWLKKHALLAPFFLPPPPPPRGLFGFSEKASSGESKLLRAAHRTESPKNRGPGLEERPDLRVPGEERGAGDHLRHHAARGPAVHLSKPKARPTPGRFFGGSACGVGLVCWSLGLVVGALFGGVVSPRPLQKPGLMRIQATLGCPCQKFITVG